MKLTILGSGTHYPSLARSAAGYLLEDKNKKILLDAGYGTIHQLLKAGVDYRKIDGILFTHLHIDHVSDLIPFLFTLKIQSQLKEIKRKKLILFGPKGLKKFYQAAVDYILGEEVKNFPLKVQVTEKEKGSFKIGGLKIKVARVKHGGRRAISYRITKGKKSVVYSGDLSYGKNIIKLAQNTDLLILECSAPVQKPLVGHLTASECGRIATEAGAKKLVLSHLYPITEKYDIVKQTKKYFKGSAVKAKDLMKIEI